MTGRQETTAQKSKPMRLAVSILAPIALAAISLFASPAEVVGQNRSAAREWSDLAKGRTEFEVSDPALVPSQLALAVQQSDCLDYELLIKRDPIRFVVLRDRRFAIVLCSVGPASNSHQLFDLSGRSNLEKPKPVRLPFLEQPDGFGTTPTPGAVTWKSETGVLVAESGSDNSFGRLRHTYRLGYLSMSFVVVRVEYRCAECSKDEWKVIWDAPHWPSK